MTDQEKEFIVNAVDKLEKNMGILKDELDQLVDAMKKANETMKLFGEQLNDLETRERRIEESHG